jgi:hypothetical protein
MSHSIESALSEIAKVVHGLASTHPFWHASNTQEETLALLQRIIADLENTETNQVAS